MQFNFFDVQYTDRKGKLYKTVRIFVVRIENENPDDNGPMLKRIGDLQKEEVDTIKWFNHDEVATMALPRYVNAIQSVLKNNK
jgi:hypothetical protein